MDGPHYVFSPFNVEPINWWQGYEVEWEKLEYVREARVYVNHERSQTGVILSTSFYKNGNGTGMENGKFVLIRHSGSRLNLVGFSATWSVVSCVYDARHPMSTNTEIKIETLKQSKWEKISSWISRFLWQCSQELPNESPLDGLDLPSPYPFWPAHL